MLALSRSCKFAVETRVERIFLAILAKWAKMGAMGCGTPLARGFVTSKATGRRVRQPMAPNCKDSARKKLNTRTAVIAAFQP